MLSRTLCQIPCSIDQIIAFYRGACIRNSFSETSENVAVNHILVKVLWITFLSQTVWVYLQPLLHSWLSKLLNVVEQRKIT